MADTDGDKTEAPTPRRRQEAREQGNIARSHDLTAALLLLATLVLLNSTGMRLFVALRAVLAQTLSLSSLSNTSPIDGAQSLGKILLLVGTAMIPLLAGVMVVAIVANLMQVGLNFTPQRLTPNFAALNPFRGVDKLFGGGLKPAAMLLNVLKLVVLTVVAYSAIRDRVDKIIL